jgi:voltage-gated potassium channel
MSKRSLTQFFYKATDTFRELFLILAGAVIVSGLLFSLAEHVNPIKGIWWAVVTAYTVGYGDTVPHTALGMFLAGLLMSFSVFVIIPLITARFTKIAVVNDDAFSHREQEQIKKDLKYIRAWIEKQEAAKNE